MHQQTVFTTDVSLTQCFLFAFQDVDEICGICSEKRATLICKECDDDIYCKACFQELHRELGEVHAPKAFKNK